ncbi:MAG: hypothetical protein JNG89_00620 [Planctomycetaceae bacterium]|nr:hypothetical protein [Planctomycetaceae bacterium]
MKAIESSGVRAGGASAWWLGLRAAIQSAKERLRKAASDEERKESQAELDRLKEQQADARTNGHRRLY